jgi:hypothetical protein
VSVCFYQGVCRFIISCCIMVGDGFFVIRHRSKGRSAVSCKSDFNTFSAFVLFIFVNRKDIRKGGIFCDSVYSPNN